MNNYQLVAELVRGSVVEADGSYRIGMEAPIRRELNIRATLALLPVLLLWRRWRALDLQNGRWLSPRPAAVATVTMVFAFLLLRFSDRFVEEAWRLPVGTAPWITLTLIALVGAIRVALAQRGEPRARLTVAS